MKIGIAGCGGRMGLTLLEMAAQMPGVTLAIGSESPQADDAMLRAEMNKLGLGALPLTRAAAELFDASDAVVDFTHPEVSTIHAEMAAEKQKVLVIGTTGFSPFQQTRIEAAAQHARIVQSGNYSLGVNVLEALIEKAAQLLDDHYDIEIDEMHHRMKKDAPSGTALMLGHAAAKGRGREFDEVRTHYGEGMIGQRTRGGIGFSVRRGGDVVGVHTVTFAGPGENLELTHRGFSRETYARGALKAALWAQHQKAGLYSMRDVLGMYSG